MAASITVPTPAAPGEPISIRVGKFGRTFENNVEAVRFANDKLDEVDVLIALAIKRAIERPASRGKVITIDFSVANNIVREV